MPGKDDIQARIASLARTCEDRDTRIKLEELADEIQAELTRAGRKGQRKAGGWSDAQNKRLRWLG